MLDPILTIFREETLEHLAVLEQGFLDLETNQETESRREVVHSLFRHAHSLKGDARAVGRSDIQDAAQELEELLEGLRRSPQDVTRELIDTGLLHLDRVRDCFQQWQNETFGAAGSDAEAPAEEQTPADVTETAEDRVREDAGSGDSFSVRVPADRLDRMLNRVGEVRILQRLSGDVIRRLVDIRSELAELAAEPDSAGASELAALSEAVRSAEGELLSQRSREQLLIESLEEEIRDARLLPLTMLADSLRRPVRELARSLGKQIGLEIHVEGIMLDKAVIEALRAPLMHLIRNASDHGIEAPFDRRRAGKPEEGTIHITGEQRGDRVRIFVSDDGAGIHFNRIRERLREWSPFGDVNVDELSEQELAEYLFQPGFSTSAVSTVSGRGVGLDVVREELQRLHGRVELVESSSAGSKFVLEVPVTISTVRILSVWEGGQPFGVPSTSVVKTLRVSPEQIQNLEGTSMVMVDREPVRWLPLSELLGRPRPATVGQVHQPCLLVRRRGVRVAVAVDELEEEREVLLKPLGFPLTGMPGVLGGTIRPDGSVQLVLDLAETRFESRGSAASPTASADQRARILVVDDSPTTRALLRNLFNAAGYSVRTANDGLEAIEVLRSGPVDLVVSDFEMPRLNGVDLTRQIKSRWKIPVILVTGREKEHDRIAGLEAGADAYLVKSTFHGGGLLETVEQFVGG